MGTMRSVVHMLASFHSATQHRNRQPPPFLHTRPPGHSGRGGSPCSAFTLQKTLPTPTPSPRKCLIEAPPGGVVS